jgi:excisionase family DNA binding protein
MICNNTLPLPGSEVLTVEQFAERMQVSRTTVFGWIKNGSLREGAHYIRLGRILRFCWQEGLFFNSPAMPETCAGVADLLPSAEALPYRKKRLCKKQGTAPAINLNYQ